MGTSSSYLISIARLLLILGAVFILAGSLLYLAARFGISLGRVPGNIRVEHQNFTCVLALGTSILLSILLTVILNLVVRFLNK
jgi:hypothetical protein